MADVVQKLDDISHQAKMELVSFLKPFFQQRKEVHPGSRLSWEDVGVGCPGGSDTMDHVILGLAPAGFWKLNESSGSIAHDSSGFGQDLSVDGGLLNPLWAQPAGPPGEQTADFQNGVVGPPGSGTGTNARVSRSWATMSGSWTVGIWVKRNAGDVDSPIMGQGWPDRSGGTGWQLNYASSSHSVDSTGNVNLPYVEMSGTGAVLAGLNPVSATAGWKFLAVTQNTSTNQAKLYVNGLLQNTISTSAFTPRSAKLWIGHDLGGGGSSDYQPCFCTLSYAFLVNRVVTGTELLAVYNALPV